MKSFTMYEPVVDDTTRKAHRVLGQMVARYVAEERAAGREPALDSVAGKPLMTPQGFEPRFQP